MSCTVNLRQVIVSAAVAGGVDPGIALAVASRESGICQWNMDGSVKRGGSGEYGVFQIMPSTGAKLGYTEAQLADVNANIQCGIKLLAQLSAQYGNWMDALAAYNSGKPYVGAPSSTVAYVDAVLAVAGVQAVAVNAAIQNQTSMAPDGTAPAGGVAPSADNNTSVGTVLLLGSVGLGAIWFFLGD